MKNRNDDRAFVKALKAEIKKRGYGAQTELAEKAGVSKSLINDIINGRTYGKIKTHQVLASALGYQDFESFLEEGRKIAKEEQLRQANYTEGREILGCGEIPSLLEILLENRALRLELEQIRKELALMSHDKTAKSSLLSARENEKETLRHRD
ncbi:MAG: helix-turn-helix domain-containing protein [Deltaproteobacteria bacterium]|jgi:transcriptional regulator with XRE-family HTH domain|nr:helix-turn-helix domain-containing protein [Deltaproteobacteria bacterium]